MPFKSVSDSRLVGGTGIYSDAELQALARDEPAKLLSLISSGKLGLAELTFAAEYAGAIQDSEAVRAALAPLLGHPAPVVREGALLGLEPHKSDPAVDELLHVAANFDASPTIRAVAQSILSGEPVE